MARTSASASTSAISARIVRGARQYTASSPHAPSSAPAMGAAIPLPACSGPRPGRRAGIVAASKSSTTTLRLSLSAIAPSVSSPTPTLAEACITSRHPRALRTAPPPPGAASKITTRSAANVPAATSARSSNSASSRSPASARRPSSEIAARHADGGFHGACSKRSEPRSTSSALAPARRARPRAASPLGAPSVDPNCCLPDIQEAGSAARGPRLSAAVDTAHKAAHQ